MAVALMWEARAAEGLGPQLLGWLRDRQLPAAPLRHELFTAPDDRVLAITWWPGGYDSTVPELPDPPPGLVRRPVHRWRFVPADGPGADGTAP